MWLRRGGGGRDAAGAPLGRSEEEAEAGPSQAHEASYRTAATGNSAVLYGGSAYRSAEQAWLRCQLQSFQRQHDNCGGGNVSDWFRE